METIKNYEIFNKEEPAEKLIDDANVSPEDVLTEEEIENKDRDKIPEDIQDAEVTEIPMDSNEVKRHVLTYEKFHIEKNL